VLIHHGIVVESVWSLVARPEGYRDDQPRLLLIRLCYVRCC